MRNGDMLTRVYSTMFTAPAWARRAFAMRAYQLISRGYRGGLNMDPEDPTSDPQVVESAFMNYGFEDPDEERVKLSERFEIARYPVQLYHHVATATDLVDKDVVEVGCGRGGGAAYVASLGPRSMTGIDLSPEAIEFCQHCHIADNVQYIEGVAEYLPFPDSSVDVIINIESSHCYDMDRFLSEVTRVLKVGGIFSWADTLLTDMVPALEEHFAKAGMELVRERDITQNVVMALAKVGPRRVETIDAGIPFKLARNVMKSMLGVPGTVVYEAYESEKLVYLSKVFRKTEETPVVQEPDITSDWIDFNGSRLSRRFQRSKTWMTRYARSLTSRKQLKETR